MSNEKIPSGDPKSDSSGIADEKPKQDDVVAYETYKRTVSQLKKSQEQVDALQREVDAKLEKEAKEKEDYKVLLKLREDENAKLKAESEHNKAILVNGSKMQALMNAVDGEIDEQYWRLVELDKILLDPVEGTPDKASVQKYASEFSTKYAAIIKKESSVKMPQDAPKSSNGKLSYEEWKSLPAKEMRKRYKEVINNQ